MQFIKRRNTPEGGERKADDILLECNTIIDSRIEGKA